MSRTVDQALPRSGRIHSGQLRTIVGYGWPWTVREGEVIDFKVSTYEEGPYKADLVRIICADDLSDPGMFKEKEIAAPFSGVYPGRLQPVHTGSYVEIDPKPCLDKLESFTVQAMVFPTALPKASGKGLANALTTTLAQPSPNQQKRLPRISR